MRVFPQIFYNELGQKYMLLIISNQVIEYNRSLSDPEKCVESNMTVS